MIGGLVVDRAAAHESAERAVAPYRPKEPAWFLDTVAVAPEAQGRGLGGAVPAPGIEAAASSGCPALPETSDEPNARFHQRLGFRVAVGIAPPGDAPRPGARARIRAEGLDSRRAGADGPPPDGRRSRPVDPAGR